MELSLQRQTNSNFENFLTFFLMSDAQSGANTHTGKTLP